MAQSAAGGWARRFYDAGEPYGGGFYEQPGRERFFRFARAQRRFWEHMDLPDYDGGKLYPCGPKWSGDYGVFPDYSFTVGVHEDVLRSKDGELPDCIRRETGLLAGVPGPHTVGGAGYTHSIPNYGRIVREGLDAYRTRVEALPSGDFRDGLLEVLEGIGIYRQRCLEALRATEAPSCLTEALARVPFLPARTLYEALVAWNFIYYADGCDNPGRLDADLADFYRGENVEDVLREFFVHVDVNSGWSSALGPDCNGLTLQCLRAIGGLRRPSLELRVTPDTPDEIWQAAARSLTTGCGQPAFYWEPAYQQSLTEHFPNIPREDLLRFNGGGCTETMLAGISNVGSLDAGINLPLIFSAWMRERLGGAADFEDFYEGLVAEIWRVTAGVLDGVNEYRKSRARLRPQPVRTLLIDDCIDRGLDFNAGGARYTWSVVNVAGLVNVIDSLLAVRTLVYEDIKYSGQAFIEALDGQEEVFLGRLRACPCFGVDDSGADALAADFAGRVYGAFGQRQPYPGGAFLPASIQFTTYGQAGLNVPVTPDGRAAGAPLADSIGPVHGKDKKGPTAMLNSVARLPQKMALGTPVLNLRLQKGYLASSLRSLVMGYFEKGGMQVQVSCLSREDILDALEHPERHGNLIVRIGGYSEYFNRLSPQLKQTVLRRTEFAGE